MTWIEALSEAIGTLTVLPSKFKTGDIITDRDQLDLLPNGTVLLDSNNLARQKPVRGIWATAAEFDIPAKIIWLPEDEEHA